MPDTTRGEGGGDLQQATSEAEPETSDPTRDVSEESEDGESRAADEEGTGRRANGRPRWPLFLALAGIVLVVDQLTKAWIVANIAPGRALPVFGDLVRLVFSQNSGALFGLFRDNATLFAIVSVGVIGAIAWYHGRSPRSALLSTALGLLLGGALGNLIDRIRLGYVVDFVDAGIGSLRFYTFNVADSAISGALLLILLMAVFPGLASEPRSTPEPAAPRAGKPATAHDAGD
jgi:signal peptidase II